MKPLHSLRIFALTVASPMALVACGSDDLAGGPAGTSGREPLGSLKAIAAGRGFTCGLTAVGTVKCWGNNESGQLGNGTYADSAVPQDVVGLSDTVSQIVAAGGHVCALLQTGAVQCWGVNASSVLGDGTDTERTYPVAVLDIPDGPVSLISTGLTDACAVVDSRLHCWGGHLYASANEPGLDIDLVASGDAHLCYSASDGSVQCAGHSGSGQLGNGTIDQNSAGLYTRDTFQPVIDFSGPARSVAAGTLFTCAVTDAGQALCWGANFAKQLGAGSPLDHSKTPLPVRGLSSVQEISAQEDHVCALGSDGHVFCWGANSHGQSGLGIARDVVAEPVQVAGIENAVHVAVGASHSCAVLGDGTAKCWGSNNNGQLGDGSTTERLSPVFVLE